MANMYPDAVLYQTNPSLDHSTHIILAPSMCKCLPEDFRHADSLNIFKFQFEKKLLIKLYTWSPSLVPLPSIA